MKPNNRWKNRDAREKANLKECIEPGCENKAEVGCDGKCRACYIYDAELESPGITSTLAFYV